MARRRKPFIAGLGVLLAGTAAGMVDAHAQQQVGTTAAVKPATTGTRPSGQVRILQIGNDLVHKERVITAVDGAAQVLFIDKSTLNLGPESDVVIDEYVFNPNAGTGRMAATIAKGALRFVGGQISHTQGITINTPAGTVGVRGGVVYIGVKAGKVTIIPIYGSVTYQLAGGKTITIQVGQKLELTLDQAGNVTNPPDGPLPAVSRAEMKQAQASVAPNGPAPPTGLNLPPGATSGGGGSLANIGDGTFPPPLALPSGTGFGNNAVPTYFNQQQLNQVVQSSQTASPPPPPPAVRTPQLPPPPPPSPPPPPPPPPPAPPPPSPPPNPGI